MSYVTINVLTVPAGATLKERFAALQGAVDTAPGFEHFELLRSLKECSDYLVYTRWRRKADFAAFRAIHRSRAGFGQRRGHQRRQRNVPVAVACSRCSRPRT
ncbi:MAG: antibiotic biosynthesis monooxygenase [Actinomycetota bacterium]|nr:antibiotic biosynthesis monooxygenase [Actinomycetota bacterium]